MSSIRLVFFVLVTITLVLQYSLAGPASRFALAAVRANQKIPRSIRAPFRNTEMMTARGFGKRSQMPTKFSKDNDFQVENQWSYGKRDTKYLEENGNDPEPIEQIMNEQPIESFSLDWFANEMSTNPILAKNILRRFVDADHDGFLTQHELMASGVTSTQDSNEPY